jgi:ubiquinol-cytochrome c reductase cytochrome b subunit
MTVKQILQENKWGGQALISLFVSSLSGIFLAWQYNHLEPFYSTASIEISAPFGSFWRSLHYYSSQAFFLLLICHLAIIIWKNTSELKRSSWIRLTLSVPVALLLLFTGYVLRGDATGDAAGTIAEHITLSIPVIGTFINDLLFAIQVNGMKRIYTNHLITLMILGGVCIWPHLRRYTVRWRDHLLLVLATILLSVLLTAPIEPDHLGILHIRGPWFFLGLQELLRYIPVFWAGIFFPTLLIMLLLFLPTQKKALRQYLFFIGLWISINAILSFISLSR